MFFADREPGGFLFLVLLGKLFVSFYTFLVILGASLPPPWEALFWPILGLWEGSKIAISRETSVKF